MIRRLVPLFLIALLLLLACSGDEEQPFGPDHRNFLVPEDMSLAAALAQAEAGDRILLTGEGEEQGHFVLPADVSIYPRYERTGGLYTILGSLSCAGATEGRIEGLKIRNDEGNGLVLHNCDVEVTGCWIVDCAGAGLELVGSSAVYAHNSDFEGCTPGVLVRDVFSSGHHELGTAPTIASNNFLGNFELLADIDNDQIEERLGPNIVFRNIAAGDTVNVAFNWWGQTPGELDPDETIWDHKDQASNKGLADTMDQFYPTTHAYARIWRP